MLDERPTPADLDEAESQSTAKAPGKALVCTACGATITFESERINFHGGHAHTRTNLHGFSYHFGCFDWAPGCANLGQAEAAHTWFPGYRWRLAVCGQCGEHLGWSFRNSGGSGFYGLILARLKPGE